MNKNICSSCGTENEPEYKYCKNCGNEIIEAQTPPETEFKAEPQAEPVNQQQTYSKTPNGFILDNISGVPTEEVALFVGKKAYKLLPKFSKMEFTGSKISWCWPVAVLGYLFGPLGAAIWFFYRKMYKLGAIFMALSLLLTVGFNLLPPVQTLYNDMAEWTEKYSVEDADEFTEEEIAQAYKEQQELIFGNPTGVILMLTQGALSLALQLFIGFNANKWYYNHTITSIKKVKSEESDPQKQRLLYFKAGGCSVGATFLAILANNMIVMAVEMLLTYIK